MTTPNDTSKDTSTARWYGKLGPLEHKAPGGVMGIVNVTADSFFPGSRTPDVERALAKCLAHVADGADILDIGAESSRPGADPISADEELARLAGLIGAVRAACPDAIISVDTYHAKTAAAVLEAGCDVINDISAARHDPEMADVLAQYRPGYVLMHCQGTPKTMQAAPAYDDVTKEVAGFFEERMNALVRAGLPEENVLLDPGIGFGKTMEHNLALMRGTAPWAGLGRPSLMACSMKRVFGELLGLETEKRESATMVATALTFARGYEWHRVHSPKEAAHALRLAAELA